MVWAVFAQLYIFGQCGEVNLGFFITTINLRTDLRQETSEKQGTIVHILQ